MKFIRFIISEIKISIIQFRFRCYFNVNRLSFAKTALFNAPDTQRIKYGNNCSIGDYTIIDIVDFKDCKINQKAHIELGDAVYIGEQCNIRASGNSIWIGADSMIANNVVIVSSNHQAAHGSPIRLQPWDKDRGGVYIGKDCWIGSHCTILSGANIGNGSIVASGAVVRGDIPPNEIWGGVPAYFIKKRNQI
jgi:acetyltransferase-like isoleucine patch superfamily enzyme